MFVDNSKMPVTTEVLSSPTELDFDDAAVLDCLTSHSKNIQEQLGVCYCVFVCC